MRDVFVTGVRVIAPGIDSMQGLSARLSDPTEVPPARTLTLGGVQCRFAQPEIAPDDPHLPSGRESRLLRRDVALGVVCAGRLLEHAGLGDEALRDAALYVATGLCQDDALEEEIEALCSAYVADYETRTEAERNRAFFRTLPPLMALTGLSNAAACYIARECRVRGPNAVFGVTSHAGYAAVREGAHAVRSGRTEAAVVGGANAAGTLSALALAPLAEDGGTLREAQAAAFVLLESEESAAAGGRSPLARLGNFGCVPWHSEEGALDLAGRGRRRTRGAPCADDRSLVLHGGSVFEHDARAMAESLADREGTSRTWFSVLGSAGAASVALDLATAAMTVSSGSEARVTCVNRDVYGRESWITVEAAA